MCAHPRSGSPELTLRSHYTDVQQKCPDCDEGMTVKDSGKCEECQSVQLPPQCSVCRLPVRGRSFPSPWLEPSDGNALRSFYDMLDVPARGPSIMSFRLALRNVRRRTGLSAGLRLFLPIDWRITNVFWRCVSVRFRRASWVGPAFGRSDELDVPGFSTGRRLVRKQRIKGVRGMQTRLFNALRT